MDKGWLRGSTPGASLSLSVSLWEDFCMKKMFSVAGVAVSAVLAGMIAAAPVAAPDNKGGFSGKTVEWWMPFSEGGGTDVWARFFAPYLSKHLPGQPNVIIRNVPGGGSITGTNEFVARARPDGLALIGTSGSTQFPYLLGDSRV